MPDDRFNKFSQGAGSFIEEFKAFALKGNIVDLAVGVIIGAAFGKVVTSLVENVIMPLLNPLLGQMGDYEKLTVGPIQIGLFLSAIVNFVIVALALFLVLKKVIGAVQNLRAKEGVDADEAAAAPSPEEKLLTEIRDLLREQGPRAAVDPRDFRGPIA